MLHTVTGRYSFYSFYILDRHLVVHVKQDVYAHAAGVRYYLKYFLSNHIKCCSRRDL